jgi:hypothetical protein
MVEIFQYTLFGEKLSMKLCVSDKIGNISSRCEDVLKRNDQRETIIVNRNFSKVMEAPEGRFTIIVKCMSIQLFIARVCFCSG